MKSDMLQNVINTLTENYMPAFTAGPIYSSFLTRVNTRLINTVSRFVTFPDGDGVEHTMWEDTIPQEVKEDISNWLGVRNTIIDAINELEGYYPPSTFEDTCNWLTRSDAITPDAINKLEQKYAIEYMSREAAGEKLYSNMKQYVESQVQSVVRSASNLNDMRDAVLNYLNKADTEKSKDPAALSYNNLPEWFDDMVLEVVESKFSKIYEDKQFKLDTRLSPSTRQAIETELLLMENVAKKLKIELKSTQPEFDKNAFLASIGLDLSAV